MGSLPPFSVASPWWQDTVPVVRGARERFGVDVVVLRLLDAELPEPPGGGVRYVAELADGEASARAGLPLEPWNGRLDEHPLRQAYARPGGPTADLAWADAELAKRGLARSGPAEQIRTWNLSSVWRLPLPDGAAWLKVVPPFLAHEGPLLARLSGDSVPVVWAHGAGRVLMPEIPGDDRYGADPETLRAMVVRLVALQRQWLGRTSELLALGVRDRRAAALTESIADVFERTASQLSADDRACLDGFVSSLPRRFDAIAACGLGDTLVHGDFHPGNFRGDTPAMKLLDWPDSSVGHPLLDEAAFLDRVDASVVPALCAFWHAEWRAAVPGCDPDTAARLLAPIAAAGQAALYRLFLDHIEPSEHPYHAADPARWLARAAELVRQG